MLELPPQMKVYLCCEPVDMRKGFDGLAACTHSIIGMDPYCGHLFVFRGRRANLIKMIFWDGTGCCLFSKRMENDRFVWPPLKDGGFQMTRSQLAILLEGMDWRRTIALTSVHSPRYV